jgi:hypothetical protein
MSASDGLGSDHQAVNRNKSVNTGVFHVKAEEINRTISRRIFINRIGKIIALGALSHFTLLTGTAFAADDSCPGGLPADDTCNPPDNDDKCPGEEPPADECPADGKKPEDVCNTGGSTADKCDPLEYGSDQCESGKPLDDQCPPNGNVKLDVCPTGRFDTDECPPNGTEAEGDYCPGGDPANGMDTCEPEGSGPSGGD